METFLVFPKTTVFYSLKGDAEEIVRKNERPNFERFFNKIEQSQIKKRGTNGFQVKKSQSFIVYSSHKLN